MKRNFVLPVALSLAFHAFLLFGFSPPAGPRVRLFKPVKDQPEPVPPVTEVAMVIPDDENADLTPVSPRPVDDPVRPPVMTDSTVGKIPLDPHSITSSGPVVLGTGWPETGTGDGSRVLKSHEMDMPLSWDQLDNHPQITRQVSPVYPREAVRNELSGTVTVDFIVDEKGHVQDARVSRSTNPVFDDVAVQAVQRWSFERGLRHGRAVRFRMQVPLAFNIAAGGN